MFRMKEFAQVRISSVADTAPVEPGVPSCLARAAWSTVVVEVEAPR